MIRIRGTFLKNWLALASADLISQALSFFSMFRVARHFAPEGYGLYALTISTAALFGLVATAGLPQVVVTEVAKRRDIGRYVLGITFRIRSVSVTLSGALIVLYYVLVRGEWDGTLVALTLVLLVNTAWLDIVQAVAFGRQVMRFSSILTVVTSCIWVVGLYVIPLRLLTVTTVLGFYTGLQVAQTVVYYVLLARTGAFRATGEPYARGVRYYLRMGAPFLWIGLTGIVSIQLPVLLLAAFTNDAQVGLYNAGFRLVLPMTIMFSALSRATLPLLVTARQHSNVEFESKVNRLFSMVVFFGGLLALALTATAHESVPLVLGEDYRPAVSTFINQMWTAYVFAVLGVIGISMAAMELQHTAAKSSTLGHGLTLVPVIVGAHYNASVLSAFILAGFIVNMLLHVVVLARQLGTERQLALFVRNVTAMLALFAVARLFAADGQAWVRTLVVVAAGLAACYWFRDDIDMVRTRLLARDSSPAHSEA